MSICGYCKSSESYPLYPTRDIFNNNYFISHCKNCNAYFLSPRPDESLLKRAYNPEYYGESEDSKFIPIIEDFVDYFRTSRARYVSRLINNKGKILDIGCGNGKFLSYISRFGDFELYGSELEGNSARRASLVKEINLKIGGIKKNDYLPENFDAITLFHVFEHLTEPKEVIEVISSVIKKDGILIVSFPNISSLQSRIFKGNWFHMDPPRHLFFFKPKDFIALMESYGFTLIKSKYFSFEQNPYGAVQSILNTICKKREVLYERLKRNNKYAPEYSKINIWLQKLFFYFSFPIFACTEIFTSLLKLGATVEFTFRKK